jgi:hypothetical protein
MSDDDSYLYLNEGGFTPGMYRATGKPQPAAPVHTKWSPWRLIPGVELGGRHPKEAPSAKKRTK